MNPFLEACGATGPLRLTVECQGVPGVETAEFDQPFLLIGRDPGSDLHFPHAGVSERHVYLQVVGGHLCYVDLGSRGGTYLEGRCLRSGWLPPHKTLRIGPYRIRLVGGIAEEAPKPEAPAAGAPAFVPPPSREASPAPLTLELAHRGIRTSVCPAHGELTLVGSSADCDVRVLDPSVSNYHASLLHTPEGVWVVDLLGLGGITVQGSAVRFTRVNDGDELRVGQSVIRVRCAARPEAACHAPELAPERPEPAAEAQASPVPAPPVDVLPVGAPDLPAALLALPAPRPAGVADSFPSPLLDQLRVMQRELFEQLRRELSEELSRSGAQLLRELTATQQEHARALKGELEHFRRLNQELDALKAELVAKAPTSNGGQGRGPAARPARLGTAVAAPFARPFTLNAEPAPAATRFASVNASIPAGEDSDRQDAPDAAPATAEEAQTWLYQRISMIQDEQQGRWQRLIDMLPGQFLSRLPV